MYKMCKTEQSAARQRELEEGLLRAMSVQQYEEISVSDLCQQIGIPRKAFYRYFSGKDGALHALIDHTLLEFQGFSVPRRINRSDRGSGDLESFFSFWQQKKPVLDSLERSGLSGILIQRAIDHALRDAGIQSRLLSQDEKVIREHAIMFCVCGLMSMMVQWHHEGYQRSSQHMADIAMQVLTQPLVE